MRDLVLTCLFSGCEDPQRPKGHENPDWSIRPDPTQLYPLIDSVREWSNMIEIVVLHDELPGEPYKMVRWEQQPTPVGNVYRERWRRYRRFLAANPQYHRIWMVDGTDVKMRQNPFTFMFDSVLYVCSEQGKNVSLPWIADHHGSQRDWAKTHGFLDLLNAGLVGGHRITISYFLNLFIDHDLRWADEFDDLTDMAAFNHTCWENFGEQLVYGSKVNTTFGAYEDDNGYAWWSHR